MSIINLPKFSNANGNQFYRDLRIAIENYLKTKKNHRFANWQSIMKIFILLGSYVSSYLLILLTDLPIWSKWLLCIVLGISMAGIGMGVMHDANHGSTSRKSWVNKLLGRTADLLGANSGNWINQHNKLHHTYTNIHGHDEDVNGKGLFRFSPDGPHRKMHKAQHLYWPILYGFLNLGWFFADFKAYFKYRKMGLNKSQGAKLWKEYLTMIGFKIFFISYLVILPYVVLDIPFWQILIGFLTAELVCGFILSVVFQMAHVVDKFDLSNHDNFEGKTFNEWAVHQLENTFNFATHNKLLTWYCGGLNYQIEHHLFPNINHIHYPKINKIVKDIAAKHKVNYQEFKHFREALASHVIFLKKLGNPSVA